MTTLSTSPFMIAMVQTAMVLPFFLLSLPAGALADIFDRRRLLMFTQILTGSAALVLGLLSVAGHTTPPVLLFFTFVIGVGSAVNAPAWQAIIPEIVSKEDLPAAITLGSVSFNIARSVGPAIGGFIVSLFGPGATFLLNAASFSGVFVVLLRWERRGSARTLPEERFLGAMRTGVRYVRNAPELFSAFLHIGLFSFFGSALWAFLPIVAKMRLSLTSFGFGLLLGCFGAGGLIGAALLPVFRRLLPLGRLVAMSTSAFGLVLLGIGLLRMSIPAAALMIVGGIGWMVVLSTLNTVTQSLIPGWVRGRVLSVFMLVFFAGLTGGSMFWGALASATTVPLTLVIAAAAMVASTVVMLRFDLPRTEGVDLTPSQHWPEMVAQQAPDHEEGPVLVVIHYAVDPAESSVFVEAMREMRRIRMRDGSLRWNLFRDVTDPGHFIESYIVESWVEHLRQHDRFTLADKASEDRVRSFQRGEPVRVFHFIAEPVGKQ